MPAIVRRQQRFRVYSRGNGQAWGAELAGLTMRREGRVDGRRSTHLHCLGADQGCDGADLGTASPDTGSPQQSGAELLDAAGLVAS
jgi:hypothetical protein